MSFIYFGRHCIADKLLLFHVFLVTGTRTLYHLLDPTLTPAATPSWVPSKVFVTAEVFQRIKLLRCHLCNPDSTSFLFWTFSQPFASRAINSSTLTVCVNQKLIISQRRSIQSTLLNTSLKHKSPNHHTIKTQVTKSPHSQNTRHQIITQSKQKSQNHHTIKAQVTKSQVRSWLTVPHIMHDVCRSRSVQSCESKVTSWTGMKEHLGELRALCRPPSFPCQRPVPQCVWRQGAGRGGGEGGATTGEDIRNERESD